MYVVGNLIVILWVRRKLLVAWNIILYKLMELTSKWDCKSIKIHLWMKLFNTLVWNVKCKMYNVNSMCYGLKMSTTINQTFDWLDELSKSICELNSHEWDDVTPIFLVKEKRSRTNERRNFDGKFVRNIFHVHWCVSCLEFFCMKILNNFQSIRIVNEFWRVDIFCVFASLYGLRGGGGG